MITDCSSFRA